MHYALIKSLAQMPVINYFNYFIIQLRNYTHYFQNKREEDDDEKKDFKFNYGNAYGYSYVSHSRPRVERRG